MQVLSSLSSIPFYAPSAGFAPTNSGDVSAIASAYQVVSATATQLYAGTSYVTSVNDAPLSASRAGNAANASLANSAWYDGTGRLISALPDSAAVSAIASAYAESAASSKLDESATADFYSTSNPSGFITGVDLSDYQPTSAMTAYQVSGDYAFNSSLSSKLDTNASSSFYPSDNPSGFISSVDLSNYATTAYVDSSVSSKLDATASSQFLTSVPSDYATTAYVDSSISGFAYESSVSGWTAKQDPLTFGYDTANKISSIDGSALAGGDAAFPTYIMSGDSAMAEITTGFDGAQDKVRPALYISGTPTISAYPRILLSENHTDSTCNSSTYLADAFELYTGAPGSSGNKIFRVDSTQVSASGQFAINRSWVSGSLGWKYGTSEYGKLTSVYDTVSSNSATWGGGGGGGGSYSAGNMISISSDVISFSSQAGITDIKLVSAMPQSPDVDVLYLIYETV